MKNTHTVAILGFGVVGGGVADLLIKNSREIRSQIGEVEIKYILDLRDFPDSPLADRVVHDFSVILNDPEVDTVIEAMGGSHPAYDYTAAALKAGKSVITPNKEVVACFGDRLLTLARKMGVSYRFEAAVGGGIPVISPMISCIRQNKVIEVRGILNGTTNFILTRMLSFGDSFEDALCDAQRLGYAESNPAADVLGTDAARKITILTALATDAMPDVAAVPTEGITGIRSADVKAAESLGRRIKLLGRCRIRDGGASVSVAPFMLPEESPLASVDGVNNAVEVIAEPLGSIMLYGPGAGGGATASAIVGDLLQTVRERGCARVPVIERAEYDPTSFTDGEEYTYYLAIKPEARDKISELPIERELCVCEGEAAFITKPIREGDARRILSALGSGLLSAIRFL